MPVTKETIVVDKKAIRFHQLRQNRRLNTAYKLQLCLTGTQVYTCITMSSRAVLLLASYRGFIAQRKVGLHSFKRFSSLLVEFSVSFRVADIAVVQQMPMCQRLQIAKADDIGCGRDGQRQLKQETTAHRRRHQEGRLHLTSR